MIIATILGPLFIVMLCDLSFSILWSEREDRELPTPVAWMQDQKGRRLRPVLCVPGGTTTTYLRWAWRTR